MILRKVRVGFVNDGDGYFDETSSYSDNGEYYYAEDVDAHIAEHKADYEHEKVMRTQAEARIDELEKALRKVLALIDEIDTSSGEEVRGVVYFEAKKTLGL